MKIYVALLALLGLQLCAGQDDELLEISEFGQKTNVGNIKDDASPGLPLTSSRRSDIQLQDSFSQNNGELTARKAPGEEQQIIVEDFNRDKQRKKNNRKFRRPTSIRKRILKQKKIVSQEAAAEVQPKDDDEAILSKQFSTTPGPHIIRISSRFNRSSLLGQSRRRRPSPLTKANLRPLRRRPGTPAEQKRLLALLTTQPPVQEKSVDKLEATTFNPVFGDKEDITTLSVDLLDKETVPPELPELVSLFDQITTINNQFTSERSTSENIENVVPLREVNNNLREERKRKKQKKNKDRYIEKSSADNPSTLDIDEEITTIIPSPEPNDTPSKFETDLPTTDVENQEEGITEPSVDGLTTEEFALLQNDPDTRDVVVKTVFTHNRNTEENNIIGVGEVSSVDLKAEHERPTVEPTEKPQSSGTILLNALFNILRNPETSSKPPSRPPPSNKTRTQFPIRRRPSRPNNLRPSRPGIIKTSLNVAPKPTNIINDPSKGNLRTPIQTESDFRGIPTKENSVNDPSEPTPKPTLPPSLPNVKIIPFVAADAVNLDEQPEVTEIESTTATPNKPNLRRRPALSLSERFRKPNLRRPSPTTKSPVETKTRKSIFRTPSLRRPINRNTKPTENEGPSKTKSRGSLPFFPGRPRNASRPDFLPVRRFTPSPKTTTQKSTESTDTSTTELPSTTGSKVNEIIDETPSKNFLLSSLFSTETNKPDQSISEKPLISVKTTTEEPKTTLSLFQQLFKEKKEKEALIKQNDLLSLFNPDNLPKPISTTKSINSEDIENFLLKDNLNVPGNRGDPIKLNLDDVMRPQKNTTPIPLFQIPEEIKAKLPLGDPMLASGIIEIAGCSYSGRTYNLNERITSLGSTCSECRCTPVGIQCLPTC